MTRITDIKKRCEQATNGPWTINDRDRICDIHIGNAIVAHTIHHPADIPLPFYIANTSFIAHSREDIPYLLSQLEARDMAIEKAREALKEIAEGYFPYAAKIGRVGFIAQAALSELSLLNDEEVS